MQAMTDPDRYGEQWTEKLAAAFVPTGIGQIAQEVDPHLRDAKGVLDAVKSRIPGLSKDLYAKRDIWGEPIAREQVGYGVDLINPVYIRSLSEDPVNKALLELGVYPARVSKSIRGVELTDQQYDDYQRIAGRLSKQFLDQLVRMPRFNEIPAGIRANIIKQTIDRTRTTAQATMMMQNPNIITEALEAKQKELRGD
jgi:hypothetical protein